MRVIILFLTLLFFDIAPGFANFIGDEESSVVEMILVLFVYALVLDLWKRV